MDHTSTGAAPVKTGKADRRADLPFLVITLTLLGVGVVMVLSASFASAYYDLQGETGHNPVYFFSRQAIFAAAGVCVMLIASRIPMRVYRACALPLLLVSIASLAAVLVIGTVVNGARRWISLGFTTFQPSEITKIAIILYFSALICKYKDRMRTFRYGIAPFAAILAVVSALLVLEPHFSATIIILAIGASMLFLGGVRLHWFIGAAGVLLVGAVAAVLFVPYVAARVASFRDPFSDLTGDGWQIVQSLYAIGSGGLSGLGLGMSRQKYLYLPEEHNGLHLLRRVRGAGVHRRLGDPSPFRHAHRARVLDLPAEHRPLQLPYRLRHHNDACAANRAECCGMYESRPLHGHLAAVFQLRRYGTAHPDGGDRDTAEHIAGEPLCGLRAAGTL